MNDLHWINRSLYPFEPAYFPTGNGRMHYVDQGSGSAVLCVHGTPTWSFLYRSLIKELSATSRVVAPDHLGFGLSDKHPDSPYRPRDHAGRLAHLVDHLGLEDITLCVHDFGGPIGLSYAIEHPEKIRRIILFNTWMWSLEGNPTMERASALLGGRAGRFLYTRLNFSPRFLLKSAFGEKKKLSREVHRHYLEPFPDAESRYAPWVLAGELIGSSEWYDALWQQRSQIREIPALLIWGMKDPAFTPEDLARWKTVFARNTVVELPGTGHFVPEEAADQAARHVMAFMRPHEGIPS